MLAATYLVYMSKVRCHVVSRRLLKPCIVWTLLKTFRLGDMVLFAALSQQKITSMVLDTITNGIVYEPLAKNDN